MNAEEVTNELHECATRLTALHAALCRAHRLAAATQVMVAQSALGDALAELEGAPGWRVEAEARMPYAAD